MKDVGIDWRLLLREGMLMSSLKHNDGGFTGLEAAIVLIAFVVVAAVFSYVVLGAGFFTTQKAQQTVYSAVGQSSSTLEVIGNVYGLNANQSGNTTGYNQPSSAVNFVTFNLGLAAGGTPVDMSKTVLVYSNADHLITLQGPTNWTVTTDPAVVTASASGSWSVTSDQNPPTSYTGTLSPNEQYTITCFIHDGIPANDKFTLEIRPAIGAAFGITRTVPGSISAVNLLY
jgi:flagellin FlaB